MQHVLNHMQDEGAIGEWVHTGGTSRHDYEVELGSGRTAAIELKGCMDGNNTLIFERPSNAYEFIIWSLCTNTGADPRRNAWSGIHTRLSAEIISKEVQVNGVVIWDMVCGTMGRPCPKIAHQDRRTDAGPFSLPPPCLYLFPATVPSPRNNPSPPPQKLEEVEIMQAFYNGFRCQPEELNYVSFNVAYRGTDTVRTTQIVRGGVVQEESTPTPIRRSKP